jgi:hypothetical protein
VGDLVSVDSAIQNQLAQALLEGKPLPLSFQTWNNTYYSMDSSGGSWSINMSRGFSRLDTVLVSFSSQANTVQNATLTQCNSFQNWHGSTTYNFTNDSYRAQLAIGPNLWPDRPIESNAEAASQLSKLLAHHSSLDGTSITPATYRLQSFIMGWDLTKAGAGPGVGMAGWSGINTRTGNDSIRWTFDNVTAAAGFNVDRMWVHLGYQVVVELRSEGVLLLD